MTGTPWRSDAAPIVLSSYQQPNNKIACDYVYGLSEAIVDNVVGFHKIVAVDNSHITVVDDAETKIFSCFKSLLNDSGVSYQDIIENEAVIKYMVSSARKKLTSIRLKNPDAAGLIVAASVEHAHQISMLCKLTLTKIASLSPTERVSLQVLFSSLGMDTACGLFLLV